MPAKLHKAGGDGPPVMMIHGFGADRLGWAMTAPALMDNHTVWLAELPAHGDAEPGGTTPQEMVADLARLLPEADEPMSLVGHSLGGTLAAHLAAEHPGRIGKAALIAPAGYGSGAPNADFLTGFARLRAEADALAHLRLLVARERLIVPQMAQYVLHHLNKPGRRDALAEIAQFVLRLDPPALPDNALLIWGAGDAVNRPDPGWLASLGDRAMVLPDTGHLPHVEAVSRVNRRLVEFLKARNTKP